jgi:hypothetical protein
MPSSSIEALTSTSTETTAGRTFSTRSAKDGAAIVAMGRSALTDWALAAVGAKNTFWDVLVADNGDCASSGEKAARKPFGAREGVLFCDIVMNSSRPRPRIRPPS